MNGGEARRACPVAIRNRLPVRIENPFRAEVFQEKNASISICRQNGRRRKSTRPQLLVNRDERIDVFGEMGLFDGLGRSAEARALEPSELVILPYAPLKAVYESRPTLLWGVVRLLAGRLRNTDAALADSVFLDVTGRTAKRLLELAGESDHFDLPITQEELAGMVGASRERVNKAIASFIRLGWLEPEDGGYTITNRQQMTIRAR